MLPNLSNSSDNVAAAVVASSSTLFALANNDAASTPFNSEETIKNQDAIQKILHAKQKFDPKTKEHTDLIKACTTDFKAKYDALFNLDKQIIIGFAVSVAATLLAFILPVSLIGLTGLAYGLFCAGKRVEVNKEYRVALNNLKDCLTFSLKDMSWAVGYLSVFDLQKISDKNNALSNPNYSYLKNMYEAISPMMNTKQLQDALDDDIEKVLMAKECDIPATLPFLKRKLSEEERAVHYSIYGLNQGGFANFMTGLYFLAVQSFNALKNKIMGSEKKSSQDLPGDQTSTSAVAERTSSRMATGVSVQVGLPSIPVSLTF